ncbi:hypothetical protein Tco_1041290 [Tanacetum coccineum]|uniref:Uncharacterized protein n=1 Tax=Tanacetum coccineum TaxID=301880 RepID=A0ABQ5GH76_9ASTR
MEVECHERELEAQEYRQRQEDIMLYLYPYDHLTWEQRMAMEEARAEIKAKEDIPIGRLYRTHLRGPFYFRYHHRLFSLTGSISGHSLSGHTPPDTTDVDSSTPPRFVHPSLARTPRCSEGSIFVVKFCPSISNQVSTYTTSESPAGDSSFESSAGPSRKRCRDDEEDEVEDEDQRPSDRGTSESVLEQLRRVYTRKIRSVIKIPLHRIEALENGEQRDLRVEGDLNYWWREVLSLLDTVLRPWRYNARLQAPR